ncbi:MAG: hypothetical protein U0704_07660 [Candidatus Eisenbacteria bacterium]
MNEHVQRCRQMLAEQITALGTLRNASSRDTGFKHWRQNTLTVLQRVWPGDMTRSERFRRISFSPSHGKADGRTLREWYARGCAEATAYLEALVATVDREGVPPPVSTPNAAEPTRRAVQEDDFPVLDLPAAGSNPVVLSQGDSLADLAAMPGTDGREAGSPAPPQLKVQLKSPASSAAPPPVAEEPKPASLHIQRTEALRPDVSEPAGPARLPGEPPAASGKAGGIVKTPARSAVPQAEAAKPAATPAVPAPPAAAPAARKPVRAGKPRKSAAPRGKLKDMLGLNALEAAADAAARELRAAAPQAPQAPKTPRATPAPAAPASPPPSTAPPTPPVSQQPAAPAPALPELDDAAAARATEDFLRTSPVLGLTGKPVQRNTDDTGFSDPDAIGIATLASDAGRHGVGEDRREQVRAELMELAIQFEAHAPQWATLQRAVTLSMEFPELAKRLMPIVLPWLGRAA